MTQPNTQPVTNFAPRAAGTADHLRVDGVSQTYGDRRVLTDVNLTVSAGQRIGLIGENGVGKSTLLRILAGEEQPDAGTIVRPARIGMLWQEVRFEPEDTLEQLVEDALSEVRAIESELDEAAQGLATDAVGPVGSVGPAGSASPTQDPATRYDAALAAAERADVWSVGARRDEVLAGLGVDDIPLGRRLGEVSGGQRSRFALAALLLQRPEALLLDEPTNHLDDAAAAFLERQLLAWRGPVVFASHDRAFLDAVATGLVDLDPARALLAGAGMAGAVMTGAGAQLTTFGGNYSDYLGHKSAERARWEAQFADEQDELKRLAYAVVGTAPNINHARAMTDNNKMSYGRRGDRVQDQISRRVRNARGRYEELQQNQVRKPPAPLTFAGIPSGFAPTSATDAGGQGLLLQLSDARVRGRLDLHKLSIEPRSRLLVTGHNGAGKSTLLSVLAGQLALDSGILNRRSALRIGLLEQDVRFADPSHSPRRIYLEALGEKRAERTPLVSLGLIAPRDLDRPAGALSVGQQRRLALALIIAKPPHVFLLDEPTNHLSLSLATELEDALGTYPGAVIVASHDRWLCRNWTGDRLELGRGRPPVPVRPAT
nr:ABC-F family ATP-binding cassette domain-containing protein [Glaciibacter superstes]